jgi:hypothetical protein
MANASNAYATISPIKANIGETIQGIEKMDFAYREEQRQIDALDQARKDKEQARNDKLREKMLSQIPKNYDTGSSSLTEFQGKIIQQGVNRLGEIYKELKNPNLNEDEKIKLEIEAQNIDNLPENLKLATNVFTKQIEEYKNGIAKGEYFRNLDFEKKVLNGFEGYIGSLDNGLPAVGFIDRNNDGKIDNLDVVDYNQMQQGVIGKWSFQKQFDLDKMAVDAAEKVGYTDITTDRNFKSVQEKKAKMSEVISVANNLLQNPDGSPTEAALSQMKKMGVEPGADSLQKVKKYFIDRIVANTDYTKKEDFDYGAQTSRMSENRQAKKDKKEDVVVTKIELSNTGFNNDSFKGKQISKKGILENGLNLGKGIKFETINGAKTGLDNSTVTNLFINTNGKIIYTADVLTKKSAKSAGGDLMSEETSTTPASYRSETRTASGTTEAALANRLGYGSAEELKAELRRMNPNQKKSNTTKVKIDY